MFVLQTLFGEKTIMVVSPVIGCFLRVAYMYMKFSTEHDRLSELTCRSNTMKKNDNLDIHCYIVIEYVYFH